LVFPPKRVSVRSKNPPLGEARYPGEIPPTFRPKGPGFEFAKGTDKGPSQICKKIVLSRPMGKMDRPKSSPNTPPTPPPLVRRDAQHYHEAMNDPGLAPKDQKAKNIGDFDGDFRAVEIHPESRPWPMRNVAALLDNINISGPANKASMRLPGRCGGEGSRTLTGLPPPTSMKKLGGGGPSFHAGRQGGIGLWLVDAPDNSAVCYGSIRVRGWWPGWAGHKAVGSAVYRPGRWRRRFKQIQGMDRKKNKKQVQSVTQERREKNKGAIHREEPRSPAGAETQFPRVVASARYCPPKKIVGFFLAHPNFGPNLGGMSPIKTST